MKRILLTVLCVIVLATPAFVQASNIGNVAFFADDQGLSCNFNDNTTGLVSVYILHVNNVDGATASQFYIVPVGGPTMSFLAGSAPAGYIALGDAFESTMGLSVAYGGCINSSSFLIYTLSYFASGTSPACSRLTFAAPTSVAEGEVIGADCSFAQIPMPLNGQLIINPDQSCQCNVATEETTWGKVKSLYR